VIKASTLKARRALVTRLTGLGRRQVGRRLTECHGAVVASRATHRNTNVVHWRARTKHHRILMAGLARLRCRNMVGKRDFTLGLDTIVARCAARRNPSVIHGGSRTKFDRAGVAGFAGLSRRNVIDVGRLPLGQSTIVTADAARDNAQMVHQRTGSKCGRAQMAGFAGLDGWNVIWVSSLALCLSAVVTCRTTRRNARVIKYSTHETDRRVMTRLARLRRRHVSCRFPECNDAVMALGATGCDAGVVHQRTRSPGDEICCRVTGLARLGCRHVIRIGGFAFRVDPVVARHATCRDACMVHRRTGTPGREIRRAVAGFASLRGRNVLRKARLTLGIHVVVARRTTCGDARMVHRRTGTPGLKIGRNVAGFAREARRDMLGVRRLAKRQRSVVTGCTARGDADVVHRRARAPGREIGRRVTRLA
jgi:hypothetical protein